MDDPNTHHSEHLHVNLLLSTEKHTQHKRTARKVGLNCLHFVCSIGQAAGTFGLKVGFVGLHVQHCLDQQERGDAVQRSLTRLHNLLQ
jgi:hypothetical protein